MDKNNENKEPTVHEKLAAALEENRRLNHAVNAFTLAMPIIGILGIAVGYTL
jgi:hypothetical protein